MMFANIDRVPSGHHLFTLYVTDAPTGTPEDEIFTEEIDVIVRQQSSLADVLAAAARGALADYDSDRIRVIGVVNQSDAYVVAQTVDGDLRHEG